MTLDARARSRLLWRQDTTVRLSRRWYKRFCDSKLHITNSTRLRHTKVPGNRAILNAVNRHVQEETKNKSRPATTARHLPHSSIQVQHSIQQRYPSTSEPRTKPTCKPRKKHHKPRQNAFTKPHTHYLKRQKPGGRGVGCFWLIFSHSPC